jgi:protein-tyrosine phosphatase
MGWLTRNFGTGRGLIRLGLSWIEIGTGRDGAREPDPAEVRRLVFVCHGNICRSAFADVVARKHGLNAASFGLSTNAGVAAHPPAAEASRALGHELDAHGTTRVEDFEAHPGDLLLAMETRQLRKLAAIPALTELPRLLLGRFATPPVPHLHDPYALDEAYMAVCLQRIEGAVVSLVSAFPGAKCSQNPSASAPDRAG